MLIEKAIKLAKHTEGLAATKFWGVDDQDTLEALIASLVDVTEELEYAKREVGNLHRENENLKSLQQKAT